MADPIGQIELMKWVQEQIEKGVVDANIERDVALKRLETVQAFYVERDARFLQYLFELTGNQFTGMSDLIYQFEMMWREQHGT